MLGYASPYGIGIVEFWIAVFLRHKSTPLANGNVNPSLQSLHVSSGSSSLFRSHSLNPLGKSRFINLPLSSNILSMVSSAIGISPRAALIAN